MALKDPSREYRRAWLIPLTVRAQVVVVARNLESEGPKRRLMRRPADQLAILAHRLYKHFPHKAALEVAIIVDGFEEAAALFEAATDDADDSLGSFAAAYRAFAMAHPHVYRLMTERPLPQTSYRRGWRLAPLPWCAPPVIPFAPEQPGPSSTG